MKILDCQPAMAPSPHQVSLLSSRSARDSNLFVIYFNNFVFVDEAFNNSDVKRLISKWLSIKEICPNIRKNMPSHKIIHQKMTPKYSFDILDWSSSNVCQCHVWTGWAVKSGFASLWLLKILIHGSVCGLVLWCGLVARITFFAQLEINLIRLKLSFGTIEDLSRFSLE